MKCLILSTPDNTDSIYVKLALEQSGHDVTLLFPADLPTRQKSSIYLNSKHYQWSCSDNKEIDIDNDYDVVWWNAAQKPFLPKKVINFNDYHFIKQQNHLFFESIQHNLAPQAFWINPRESALKSRSIVHLLKTAQYCGMAIPETLCSNSPKDIRYFLLKHEEEGVLYKPLSADALLHEKELNGTSEPKKISFLELPSNQLLQLTPAIFQQEIKKQYQLRVTCFGDHMLAAKVQHAQKSDSQVLTMKSVAKKHANLSPYSLSPLQQQQIRQFMQSLGLVFASLDFIVSPDEECFFINADEQGDFLYLEDHHSDFKMLDMMTQFLINKKRAFSYHREASPLRMADYRHEVDEIVQMNSLQHVHSRAFKTGSSSFI